MQDAMIISSPPPEGYPSGVFSIQIHQVRTDGLDSSLCETYADTQVFLSLDHRPRTAKIEQDRD
jgi:hypothetical protein